MPKRTRRFKGQKIYNTDSEMKVTDEDWERIFGKKQEDYLNNRESSTKEKVQEKQ